MLKARYTSIFYINSHERKIEFIKQSLAIVLTITSLFAGEEIIPLLEPVANKVDYDSHTSTQRKVQTYYYTFEEGYKCLVVKAVNSVQQ